jgi:hypothetical protein
MNFQIFKEILPEVGVEELLMGLSSQIAEREDSVLCSDVRGIETLDLNYSIIKFINKR